MAGLVRVLVSGERQGSILCITKPLVIPRQFCSKIDDGEVHEFTASFPAVILRRCNQARAQSGSLSRRIDRQQAKISSFFTQFDVNAGEESAGGFSKLELALL